LRLVTDNRAFFEQLVRIDVEENNKNNNSADPEELVRQQFDKLVDAIEKLVDEELNILFTF